MSGDIRQLTSATFRVMVAGTALPADLATLMTYAAVEDNLNLPDMFSLAFLDPDRTVIGKGGLQIGAEVEILVVSENHPSGEKIFGGEVTAVEAELEGGKTHTVVRGFDQTHRLYRGRRSRVFKNVKYSDIVKKVAAEHKLAPGRIEDPPGKPSELVSQMSTNDAEFLAMLAGEVGFTLLVSDGKIDFHVPAKSAVAPAAATDLNAANPLQLVQGDNLLRFNATVTADSQVKQVSVRSWDIDKKRVLVGTAQAGTTTSAVDGASPAGLAALFGDSTFTAVDVPYADAGQVQAAAKALAEQIGGSHAQLEGVARGNPSLRAGAAVSLGLVGKPFDGKYTLTTTRHVYDNGEYLTHISCTGRHERSLQTMTSGGGSTSIANAASVSTPIAGAVSGIVTNVNDKDKQLGRVKVKIPRFDDSFETDWLRVVQPGAGAGRGSVLLPEVGDEVLVCFEHGDIRRGYVLGGLYNGVDKPSAAAHGNGVSSSGKVDRRSITSRKGHFLLLSDSDGSEFVELATTGSKFSLKLAQDSDGGTILLSSDNKIKIDAKGDITISGKGKIAVEASGDLTLKGLNVAIEGKTGVEIKGVNVMVEGSATAEVSGAKTTVKASAMLDLTASGIASLKGSVVKIN